ncbi:hypothetical protein [Bacillus sp. JCM 19034]|uniref:hypothetical protein n=1 Tax=Bacillus sp. JCM 19034 TaxID=1481928 RepID=UPI000784FADD|nr:hypothetical protein [Bacillus sp. JCM 19034]
MEINRNSIRSKVTMDLLSIQFKWSCWFIPIVFLIYLCSVWFVPEVRERDISFIAFSYEASKIYMLVIGIMVFLAMFSHFMKFGVTRKDYFVGSALAAVALSLFHIITSAIITTVVGLSEAFSKDYHLSFIEPNTHLVVLIVTLSLTLISYYVAGWIIAIGFYRYGGLGGLGFIVIALVYIALIDIFWGRELLDTLSTNLPITISQMPIYVSLFSTVILTGVGLLLIRNVTKRVRIKLE